MLKAVAIVGIGQTECRGLTPTQDFRELIYTAAKKAYIDAGLTPRDIDALITNEYDFYAGISIADEYTPDQVGARLKFDNLVCNDGTIAFINAYMLILSGAADVVAVELQSKIATDVVNYPEVLLASEDVAKRITDTPVWIDGVGMCIDSQYWMNRDLAFPYYVYLAAQQAYRMAGISNPLKDINVWEPYDPFDYKELHHLDGLMGRKGFAPKLLAEGQLARDGGYPSCPSGGLQGVGNPIAAAGTMKVCELYWQLSNQAGKRQIDNAKTGIAQAWGDLMQVATVVVCRT